MLMNVAEKHDWYKSRYQWLYLMMPIHIIKFLFFNSYDYDANVYYFSFLYLFEHRNFYRVVVDILGMSIVLPSL